MCHLPWREFGQQQTTRLPGYRKSKGTPKKHNIKKRSKFWGSYFDPPSGGGVPNSMYLVLPIKKGKWELGYHKWRSPAGSTSPPPPIPFPQFHLSSLPHQKGQMSYHKWNPRPPTPGPHQPFFRGRGSGDNSAAGSLCKRQISWRQLRPKQRLGEAPGSRAASAVRTHGMAS